jgi:D-alanine-D-alanine ligase-like ATP-grasp enzyme
LGSELMLHVLREQKEQVNKKRLTERTSEAILYVQLSNSREGTMQNTLDNWTTQQKRELADKVFEAIELAEALRLDYRVDAVAEFAEDLCGSRRRQRVN